ncbi:MAG TPA: hypothetical protein VFU16_02025 [Solirubrobacterales bacterium]|nr:hypothetical protein [Solirubrobacterales bacterium]
MKTITNWSARDKAVGLLCLAVIGMIAVTLVQGQFSTVAMLPVVAIIALMYHAIWEIGVRGSRSFFEWLLRRRQ